MLSTILLLKMVVVKQYCVDTFRHISTNILSISGLFWVRIGSGVVSRLLSCFKVSRLPSCFKTTVLFQDCCLVLRLRFKTTVLFQDYCLVSRLLSCFKRGFIKYELRVTCYELRVTSYQYELPTNIRVTSQMPYLMYELRKMYELRVRFCICCTCS